MSGIAGIIHFDGAPIEPGLIEKMTASMSYRGPDGIYHWQGRSIALGQCMLHTTSESLEEIQPWKSDDGRYVLVMDGRLDNWEELKQRLELKGCRLRNRSDAELVLQSFILWGIDCLKYVEGDFALIIWDNEAKKLHCVRDRMGNKPFHYHWNGSTFAFASDLRSLLVLPWIKKIPNESMLVDYLLAQWCTRDETLWKDIYRLPQAQRLEVEIRSLSSHQYWEPILTELLTFSSDEEYIECYRSLFIEAVRRSSRSHKNVAYEVSGGLDSSAIFGVADHLLKSSKLPAPEIDAYTLSFPDDETANELDYARSMGEFLGRTVHEIEPSQPSIDWLRTWAKENAEFPPHPNGCMHIGIRDKAKQRGSRAVLVGVGGDEWLGAGRSYYAEEIHARRWAALNQCWQADLRDYGLVKSLWWLARFGLAPLLPDGIKSALRKPFSKKHPFDNFDLSWLTPKMQALAKARKLDLHIKMQANFSQLGQRSKWNMLFSPNNTLGRETMEKLSSYCGIEQRWPFLNLQFVQFAFMSPDRIRLRGQTDKFIHRKAMQNFLPTNIQQRQSKAVFSVMFYRYLFEMESQLCHHIPERRKLWVDKTGVMGLYSQIQNGPSQDAIPEWQLWGLLGCDALDM